MTHPLQGLSPVVGYLGMFIIISCFSAASGVLTLFFPKYPSPSKILGRSEGVISLYKSINLGRFLSLFVSFLCFSLSLSLPLIFSSLFMHRMYVYLMIYFNIFKSRTDLIPQSFPFQLMASYMTHPHLNQVGHVECLTLAA